jgi:hypothetical protein
MTPRGVVMYDAPECCFKKKMILPRRSRKPLNLYPICTWWHLYPVSLGRALQHALEFCVG